MDPSASSHARTATQDFAAAPADASTTPIEPPKPKPHVRFPLNVDTSVVQNLSPPAESHGPKRSDTGFSQNTPFSPVMRRRFTRAATFRTVEDFEDFEVRPGWQPGAEPGVDTSKPDGGHATMPQLNAPCDITVVDFSQDGFETQRLDNNTIGEFLKAPPPKWKKCRWINVNGLSWDVIQAIGQHKKLHRLAIEDLMNTRNRTKADWYQTHTYMVLTLQKLVHLDDPPPYESLEDTEDDAASWKSGSSSRFNTKFSRRIKRMFRSSQKRDFSPEQAAEKGPSATTVPPGDYYLRSQPTGFSNLPCLNNLRTLQRYHASPNDARTEYMEQHSVLRSRHLAVVAEQVSIFLTDDNTVISFFELSAGDVEKPILTRLTTPDTILRRSCDASMVAQAIMDAIIDLAIPVTACYADVIGDLEMDVLTRPNVDHTKNLYITITEINKMLSFINPIMSLLNALRDHKSMLSQEAASRELQNPERGVVITPMTNIYLGDVLDHCVLITENLEQVKGQAEGMISLIFNTISAYQNNSMKQLTIATIIFLPMTFLTGYYGQNFEYFPDVKEHGPEFFWGIAGPTIFATIMVVMWETIWDYLKVLHQRRHVLGLRKDRKRREKKRNLESRGG